MANIVNLIRYFLIKDIRAKYAGSGLGILWAFLMPLLQIILFWFVFSSIMKARPYANMDMPYIYFLLSAFFFWLAFSEGLFRATNAIVENAEIVKKVSFPNVVLPVTVTLSTYLHHMTGFVLFLILYAVTTTLSPTILLVIPVLFLQILFSLGLGMLLSSLLPYVRDLGQILGSILQGMFFLSPIIYSIEAVPEKLRFIFYFNPMTYFASSYHQIILLKEMPPMVFLIVIFFISVGSFIGGLYSFRKLKDGFADVL